MCIIMKFRWNDMAICEVNVWDFCPRCYRDKFENWPVDNLWKRSRYAEDGFDGNDKLIKRGRKKRN